MRDGLEAGEANFGLFGALPVSSAASKVRFAIFLLKYLAGLSMMKRMLHLKGRRQWRRWEVGNSLWARTPFNGLGIQ